MRVAGRYSALVVAAALPVAALIACSALVGCDRGMVSRSGPAIRLPAADPDLLPAPAENGTRGPMDAVFSPDGGRLYLAEKDENTVDVIDTATGQLSAQFASGGEQPTALALSSDGKTLAAANTFSGVLALLDAKTGAVKRQTALPGEPCGVALLGDRAFVSLGQLQQVAVVDLLTGMVRSRIAVGSHPRTLLIAPDMRTLICLNRIGGSVSLIDVDGERETKRIALPATNLRGSALSPDGRRLYVASQQAHNDLPTERPEAIWSNTLCVVRLYGRSASVERVIALDTIEQGAADPCGVAIDREERFAYVTLSGTHELMCVPLKQGNGSPTRVHVGANPRAIAYRPERAELWIANHLGNSLCVLSAEKADAIGTLRTIALADPTPTPARRLKGLYLFNSAHIVRGQHFSCESCHPDGGTDGLSWKLSHVKERPELRNSKDLRGSLLLTGPYGWTSREEDFEKFVLDEVAGLLKTRALQHPEVHALWDLVNESPLPSNPYRDAAGALTLAAQRGEILFNGAAGCARCHSGEMRGGTNRRAWIGTTEPGVRLDVPHLVGAYQSAPYLHDGSAATLEDIFVRRNPLHLHGAAHTLSPDQLADVLEFVREQ